MGVKYLWVKKKAYGCKQLRVKKTAYVCKTAQGEEISLRVVGQLILGKVRPDREPGPARKGKADHEQIG
ncbi:protein SUPPRESSOR OF npr1-1, CONSTITUTIVE 1-like [Dorcoceras hygrometricum]|uniref:Protein SUPPRESSOR OF npr1-1, CONSTITUTIVE 1-like n=1 Tax=Dorcoceras hygrometricum TaxID=472368 RepID=A0A2Z7C143_9LAMI|nr:protein SUPPRESSOR OF npr1-1, CONSTITUTIVE 1-like [Dorcoceras hygrometricum]